MSSARQALIPTLVIQGSLVVSGILTARLLGPEARGYLALGMLLPTVLTVVGTLGFPSALAYFVARGGNAVHLSRGVLAFAVALGSLLTAATALLLVVFFGHEPPAVFSAVVPTVIVTPLIVFQTMVMALHQGRSDFAAMNATRVIPFASWGVGVGLLAALGSLTLASAYLAFVAAYVISALIALGSLRRITFAREGESPPLRGLLGFGLRGMVGTISPLENLRLDQLVVGALQSPFALGIYSTAQAFYTLPRLLGVNIGMLAYPSVARADAVQQRMVVTRVVLTSAVAIGAVTAAIMFSLPFAVPVLFGEAFSPSIPVAEVLMIASFSLALRRLAADLLRGLGRPGSDSLVEIASWPVLVIALFYAAEAGPAEVAAAVAATALSGLVVSLLLLMRAVHRLPRVATPTEVAVGG